jgi:hypothetical protein
MTRAQFEAAMWEVSDGITYLSSCATDQIEWPNIWQETEPSGDAIYDAPNSDDERHAL